MIISPAHDCLRPRLRFHFTGTALPSLRPVPVASQQGDGGARLIVNSGALAAALHGHRELRTLGDINDFSGIGIVELNALKYDFVFLGPGLSVWER